MNANRGEVVVDQDRNTPNKNAELPCDERVEDLLSRMTLEEKIAQMHCLWRRRVETLIDGEGRFEAQKARAAFANGRGLGQVARPSDAGDGLTARRMAELTNEIQRFFIETSRLGTPVIFHEECLHGLAARGDRFPSRSVWRRRSIPISSNASTRQQRLRRAPAVRIRR